MKSLEGFEKTQESTGINLEKIASWNTEGYRIEHHGENPSIVLIGEFHHTEEQQKKQLELIELLRPEYVLHESLEGYIYDPEIKQFLGKTGTRFSPQDEKNFELVTQDFLPTFLVKAANAYGFKIIGCDTTEAELLEESKKLVESRPEQFSLSEDGAAVKNELTKDKVRRVSDEMMVFRDEKIASHIAEYQNKSEKPIIAIVGAFHEQAIWDRKLLGENTNYISINQCILNGEATKDFDLAEYKEIQWKNHQNLKNHSDRIS